MKQAIITLGGGVRTIAPLKSLQVAEFLDDDAKTQVELVTKTLRTIARSMRNASDPLVDGLDDDAAIAKVNETAEWGEIDQAFKDILDLSGMRKASEGEAAAAESTSSESSAAS